MPTIWERFDRAFQDVEAWAIICAAESEENANDPFTVERTATASFKTTGRRSPHGLTVRCYLHLIGSPMVVGTSKGGGYDMRSAAFHDAVRKLAKQKLAEPRDANAADLLVRFQNAGDSAHWHQYVTGDGFTCFQAI